MTRKKNAIDPEELERKSRILRVMEGMADSQKVPKELAAIFLDVSEKTLARLRQSKKEGSGPAFIQYITDDETTAQNQNVKYEMGDLRKYTTSLKVKNTMEGAVLRGMAFSTLSDCLIEENPFWIQTIYSEVKGGIGRGFVQKSTQIIIGHLFNVSEEQLRNLVSDPHAEIQNLSLDEAMRRPWKDPDARKPFHDSYVEVLQRSIAQSNTQQEAADLHSIN